MRVARRLIIFLLGPHGHILLQANADDDAICNVFSTYYMDIETPWMIVAPLEEIEPTVHPCAPEYPENPDFWAQWRQQLYGIALELSQAKKMINEQKRHTSSQR